MMLNIDIPDIEGNPLLQMTDNEWEFFGELTDLECPPGGRSISIESKPFKLNLIFSEADTTDLQEAIEMAQTYNFDLNIKFPALLVHFKGEMFLPSFLRITDDEIQYNNSVFKISGPMFNAIPFSLN